MSLVNKSVISKFSIIFCMFLINLNLFASGHSIFKLNCAEDHRLCSLLSNSDGENEIKVQNLKCVDENCKDSFIIADDDHWYLCQHTSKRDGECQKIFNTNTQKLQAALTELLYENLARQASSLSSSLNSAEQQYIDQVDKKSLPFESLTYGRRRRQLPFETLNYGKRSFATYGCDCSGADSKRSALPFETILYGKRSLPFETLNYGKRSLPFETLNYGKRSLPFETLNYGKRAYIPIDGYIMGKREE